MFANPWGRDRVNLLFLMKVIELLQPKTVLEVGFGRGINLLLLAARYPNIRFAGVELSTAGVDEARSIVASGALPKEMRNFSPLPLRDIGAVTELELHEGSAEALRFSDGAFDLVFTKQALEQMETIRHKALSEISRVSSAYVALIEPFYDWNSAGIRRQKIQASGYFSATVADLAQYDINPLFATNRMPNQVKMHIGAVVAQVIKGQIQHT
ncbi:MAG: class I SAM-dependent methyltransferase [Haliea sp.]